MGVRLSLWELEKLKLWVQFVAPSNVITNLTNVKCFVSNKYSQQECVMNVET